MNQVTLVGWMARKDEVKELTDTCVLNFNVATRKNWKGKDGKWNKGTEYTRCVLWGNRAEFVSRLDEGSPISVDGRLSTRSYEKDGNKVWTTEVVVNNVEPFGEFEKKKESTSPEEELSF